MKVFRTLAAAVLVLVTVLSSAAPASAAGGGYGAEPTGPVMYQTNYWYTTTTVASPAPPVTPANGVITTVYWSYSLSSYNNIRAQLCNPDGAQLLCLELPAGVANGYTNAWAGYSAPRSWLFRFAVATPTTYLLSPYRYGYRHNISVNYTY